MRVVLPQPEGPRREKNSPFLISREMSFSALKSPKDLDIPKRLHLNLSPQHAPRSVGYLLRKV